MSGKREFERPFGEHAIRGGRAGVVGAAGTGVGLPRGRSEQGAGRLQQDYEEENRGLRLQRRDGRVLLVTNPAASPVVEAFLELDLKVQFSARRLRHWP